MTTEKLFSFIENSPTAFHAIEAMRCRLKAEGYQPLLEGSDWNLQAGGKYYVIRNGSSIIAFRIPAKEWKGFQIMASHSDSPMFKIKENPEIEAEGHYVKLNVEKYGGMLCAPWFDRPLSVAGRLVVKDGEQIVTKLVDVKKDLVMIPSLAIHMNRDANNGVPFNPQKELLPLYGDENAKGTFMEQMAALAGVARKDILAHDLYVYSRTPGTVWGASGEYISCGRLDDLQCAFSSLEGFLQAQDGESIPLHCVFDNEEVGSGTKQGTDSTFLKDVLERINDSLGRTREQYLMAVASSFMISADNAHAVHPNHADVADPTNRPSINEGIVIKYNANQKYTTDAVSAAVFKALCKKVQVPVQTFINRSDIAGGSTLGNISNAHVSLNTVDIGLPQFAMHSPYETAGVKDTCYLIKAATAFFNSCIVAEGNGNYTLGE